MVNDEKKYSLINVDMSSDEPDRAVRTSRYVENGEEVFVVQSGSSSQPDEVAAASLVEETVSQGNEVPESESKSEKAVDITKKTEPEDQDEDDASVPYPKMQGIIIISLIVLMVVFILYFNFLR